MSQSLSIFRPEGLLLYPVFSFFNINAYSLSSKRPLEITFSGRPYVCPYLCMYVRSSEVNHSWLGAYPLSTCVVFCKLLKILIFFTYLTTISGILSGVVGSSRRSRYSRKRVSVNDDFLKGLPLEKLTPFFIADLPKTLLFHSRICMSYAISEKLAKNTGPSERTAP